ncbi:MAG: hypothetical protein WC222_05835 [Parachlamydiales bacterium]|jgi:hypothetical protein
MSKENYDKVESAMDETMQKLKAEKLIHDSGQSSNFSKYPENLRSTKEKLAELELQRKKDRRLLATSMKLDVDKFFKKNKQFYSYLGTFHEEFLDLVHAADSMDDPKWKRLLEIKAKLDVYRANQKKMEPQVSNEALIKQQLKTHINKRYKVKDGWLPLY